MGDDIKKRRAYNHELAQYLSQEGFFISSLVSDPDGRIKEIIENTNAAIFSNNIPDHDAMLASRAKFFIKKSGDLVILVVRCAHLDEDGLATKDSKLALYEITMMPNNGTKGPDSIVSTFRLYQSVDEYLAGKRPVRHFVRNCASRVAHILGA